MFRFTTIPVIPQNIFDTLNKFGKKRMELALS